MYISSSFFCSMASIALSLPSLLSAKISMCMRPPVWAWIRSAISFRRM